MANANLPPDVHKAALDLAIAVKRANVAAPAPEGQHHIGGKDFLEMTAEALVATAHFIIAAAPMADPEVQQAVQTLQKHGRAAHERTSVDDLVELRRKVVG